MTVKSDEIITDMSAYLSPTEVSKPKSIKKEAKKKALQSAVVKFDMANVRVLHKLGEGK